MNRTPAERLKELREKRGYSTAKEAADALGWNEVTYRAHENGTRNIPLHIARKYATALGSDAAYILGLTRNGGQQQSVNHVIHVPLVGRVSAGAFRYEEGLKTKGIAVPAVPRADIPAGVQYAVEIDGPSVNMKIADGAFAICAPLDKYPGYPKHGQLVHVVRERAGLFEHTIKEIQYTPDGAVLVPRSTDPQFQEIVTLDHPDEGTTVTIQGVVIGSYQPF